MLFVWGVPVLGFSVLVVFLSLFRSKPSFTLLSCSAFRIIAPFSPDMYEPRIRSMNDLLDLTRDLAFKNRETDQEKKQFFLIQRYTQNQIPKFKESLSY